MMLNRERLKKILFYTLELSAINALFRWKNAGKVKALMFHSISEPGRYFDNAISEEDFRLSLHYLKKRYSILRFDQDGGIFGYCPDRVNVLLTFDDGFIDNLKFAAPAMKDLDISGVFFLIADCMTAGAVPDHIEIKSTRNLEIDTGHYRTLNVSQAVKLLNYGMTIGSHGCNHIDYTKSDYRTGIMDAIISKHRISESLGVAINAYAFPWGNHHPNHPDDLCAHYRHIFTTQHGFNLIDDRIFFRSEVANFLHLRCAASGALDFFKEIAL